MSKLLNIDKIKKELKKFPDRKPFPFAVIDNFFKNNIAKELEIDFPEYLNKHAWYNYDNYVERKKTSNNWNIFPKKTYQIFQLLISDEFVKFLQKELTNYSKLYSDPGLYGGGWHIQKSGDKLNLHLDNSIHVKSNLVRRLNLIVYLNSSWKEDWGGNLGFWDNKYSSKPGKLIETIVPLFNRAVIFDTSMNSWHGISNEITSPKNQHRKSLAIYYYEDNKNYNTKRFKALFVPTKDQENDIKVLQFIKKRSDEKKAAEVYDTEKK